MANVYLRDLPVELLYCIFGHLDVKTILRSLRPVCKRLYDVIDTYGRFQLNLTSMSLSDVRLVVHLILPDRISSITFSDIDTKRLNEIDLFLSVFDIRQFNQLKSMALGQIDTPSRQTLAILSKAVHQHILFQLLLSNLDYLVQHIFHPVQHTLQHLTIGICTYYQYRIILRSLPSLQTFAVEYCDMNDSDKTVEPSSADEKHQQLKSLIIHNCQLPIEYLRLFLILTPFLVRLKLVSSQESCSSVFDGSTWEQFIRIRLPRLKTFEFFFVYPVRSYAPIHNVKSIVATFQTPFWIDEKHWLTTCDYVVRTSQITLYTMPICMKDYDILIRCAASSVNNVCHLIRHRTNEQGDVTANETLTTLDLRGYRIVEQAVHYLADVLSNDVTINTLDLHESLIRAKGLEQLAYALRTTRVLTTLHLGNNQIGASGARYLAEALKINSTLRTLHLGNNQLGASGAQYLAETLRTNSTLLTLDLPSNQIGNEGIQYLANRLRENTTLTTLSLRLNQIGDSGVQHLAMALENNTGLVTLDLAGNHFGALGAQLLVDALKRNTTLTILDLQGNNLGAKSTQYLANALPYITTLTTLNLSFNQIWDQGARSIADALPNNTSLSILDLAGNDIEEPGAQYLANALRNNTQLITLNLARNSISDQTMQMIGELLLKNLHMKKSN